MEGVLSFIEVSFFDFYSGNFIERFQYGLLRGVVLYSLLKREYSFMGIL